MKANEFLLTFTAKLKESGRLPKNIELSSLTSGTMASIYDAPPSNAINESVFCGVDPNPATAILKGLVEMIERQAFSEGYRNGLPYCQTKRSDGFAAFPVGIVTNSSEVARENALCESIERHVWASWWDNSEIGHDCRVINFTNLTLGELLLLDLEKHTSIDSVTEIRPWCEEKDRVVIIYLAFLSPVGVVSGGACGKWDNVEGIRYRAIAELLRHGLAASRLQNSSADNLTFYEKRLRYFAQTTEGTELVKMRLRNQGSKAVTFPHLEFDAQVPHSLSELVAVHRCHFENQPEFIGGELERLCL